MPSECHLTAMAATQTPVMYCNPISYTSPTTSHQQIPERIALSGIRHEYQQFNNCEPAKPLDGTVLLGLDRSQYETREYLRPSYAIGIRTSNASNPLEIVDREKIPSTMQCGDVGGYLTLLKRLVAAGFPVMIEKDCIHLMMRGWDIIKPSVAMMMLVASSWSMTHSKVHPGIRSRLQFHRQF